MTWRRPAPGQRHQHDVPTSTGAPTHESDAPVEPASRGLARDATWSYAAFSLILVASFIVTALGFRELSNHIMGVYALATATAAVMAVVDPALAMGVSRAVSRLAAGRVAESDEHAFIQIAHAVLVWLGGILLAVVGALAGLALMTGWVSMNGATWWMVAFVALGCCVQIATAALPGVLTGHSDFYRLARASLVQGLVLVVVTAVLLPALGVAALGLAQFSSIVLSRATLVRSARRYVPGLPALSPRRPTRAGTRRLVKFATPLLVVAVAGQVIAWSDLVVLGAAASASVVALFRVGTIVPMAASSLIYRAYDVAFPRLSHGGIAWQDMATATLTRVFSAIAAVGFACLIAVRSDVVRLVTGKTDHFAELVIVLSALTWAASVPAHGLALLAISRDEQAPLTPVVICEAVANIALTITLVVAWRPAGAAVATLLTLSVSNLIALPLIMRKRVPGAIRLVLADGLIPLVAVGAPSVIALELLSHATTYAPARLAILSLAGLALLVGASSCAAGRDGRRAIKLSLLGRGRGGTTPSAAAK